MIIKIENYPIKISNPKKKIYPDLTKQDVIEYYKKIADYLLPWLLNYPLTLRRFPEGIKKEGFYQKKAPKYFPDYIVRTKIPLKTKDKVNLQPLCNNKASLIYLANLATLEFHRWLAAKNNLNKPTLMIFDLDPPNEKAINILPKVAFIVKELLDKLSIKSFPMLTGSRGLHIVVPLKGEIEFDAVRKFSKRMVDYWCENHKDLIVNKPNPRSNKALIFVDYLRNSYGQTAIAPYSLRARDNAPVAAPINWNELNEKKFDSQAYTIHTIHKRLAKISDPWPNFWKYAKNLNSAQKTFDNFSWKTKLKTG